VSAITPVLCLLHEEQDALQAVLFAVMELMRVPGRLQRARPFSRRPGWLESKQRGSVVAAETTGTRARAYVVALAGGVAPRRSRSMCVAPASCCFLAWAAMKAASRRSPKRRAAASGCSAGHVDAFADDREVAMAKSS